MEKHPITLKTDQACLYADKALSRITEMYGGDEPLIDGCQYIIEQCETSQAEEISLDAFGLAICATYADIQKDGAKTPELVIEELRLLMHRILFNIRPDYPFAPESRVACLRILALCGSAEGTTVRLPSDLFTDAMLGLTWGELDTQIDQAPSN